MHLTLIKKKNLIKICALCHNIDKVYASVAATPEWKKLSQHVPHIKSLHLRNLLSDPVR
jgi:hypothetical protein